VNAETLGTVIVAAVAVLGMLGSLVALTYRMGTLSGRIMSFMETAQRDRTEVLTEMGKIGNQLERHIETHHRSAI
jgi:hypothetical protein